MSFTYFKDAPAECIVFEDQLIDSIIDFVNRISNIGITKLPVSLQKNALHLATAIIPERLELMESVLNKLGANFPDIAKQLRDDKELLFEIRNHLDCLLSEVGLTSCHNE